MSEAKFFKTTMKRENRCRVCGKTLSANFPAYMRKNSVTGKWEFECLDCYEHKETASELSIDEIAEALSISTDSFPAYKEGESPLDKIAINAKWRLSDV